jgi:hypothetical protein
MSQLMMLGAGSTGPGVVAEDEVQRIFIRTQPSAGDLVLAVAGFGAFETVGYIDVANGTEVDAAAVVQTARESLDEIGSGNVSVSVV